MDLVGLDFETYASTDLPKRGLSNYVNCPDFRPLLAAVVWREGGVYQYTHFDFVGDHAGEVMRMRKTLLGARIAAHNAGFEQAVLKQMGIDIPSDRFVDSAVIARAAGAGGKLEAAAPQLLGTDKLAVGYELIKLFSIPQQYQLEHGDLSFDRQLRLDHPVEWAQFAHYCAVDAELSLRLAREYNNMLTAGEEANNAVTMDMNNTGWHVDMDMVRNMHTRYQANVDQAVLDFRIDTGAWDLNLGSHAQLVQWCADRGVRASSFDEAGVAKLLNSLSKKIIVTTDDMKQAHYQEVIDLLKTKQILGGSSLKKLQTIIDTVGPDGRLHDQYLHIGAGATYRTTGRGVQMQNLKRLNGQADDMSELFDEDTEWDNGKLASNLRQVFTATDPLGQLVVGDFSSVESRGLAWQAGELWKTEAYFRGEDLYSVQAARILGITEVSKDQRQFGKVGELSCGYGAGGPAVREFAAKMGVDLSEGEAAALVRDWREANPAIVSYWNRLDGALHDALMFSTAQTVDLPHGSVRIFPVPAPQSLRDQVGNHELKSLKIKMVLNDLSPVLDRVIHGTRIVGRNIQYWKPSERKTGDLWVDHFTNPKTRQIQQYNLYGGKLAGLLTQSLCREVFFQSLRLVHEWTGKAKNVQLVGQFHDEIVLDWTPGLRGLSETKAALELAMTHTTLPGFPLAADIKSDYRYTK